MSIKIGIFVDEYVSQWSETDPDDQRDNEYESIERECRERIGGDLVFRRNVSIEDSGHYNLYILDFGGVAPYGGPGEMERMCRSLRKQIEDNPSTTYLIYSRMAVRHYQCYMADDLGIDCLSDLEYPANLFFFTDDWKTERREQNENEVWGRIRDIL